MEQMYPIELTVNGQTVRPRVPARRLLVHLLRDELHLTGTHVGCDTSQCGACAVEIDNLTVKACTVLALQADGRRITTIEGVSPDHQLDPVQLAFHECHGLQCGFCTPGMVMATRELLRRHPDPTDEQIREGLHGNLCRCTGYTNIVASVRRAAARVAQPVGSEA
jgi:aerobic carbon-monoxide dehydrogenase small subunit